MNEESRNITIQDIQLEHSSHNEVFSNISSILYEEEFQYLGGPDPEQEHLLMNKLKLNPQYHPYTIKFILQKENLHYQEEKEKEVKNIASVEIKEDKDEHKIIRLPSVKSPIRIEVKTDRVMTGIIDSSENQIQQSTLYSSQGDKVASFSFSLRKMPQKALYSNQNELELQNLSQTLNSKDFQSDRGIYDKELTQIDEQLKNTLEHIQQESQDNYQTIKTCVFYPRTRKKKHYDDENSDKESEIQYLQQEASIVNRINSFRTPIEVKQLRTERHQINFSTLRRCKEELGLIDVDLESMFLPRHNKQDSNCSVGLSTLKIHLQKNSNINILNLSKQKSFQQRGVETYSPLSSFETSKEQTDKIFRTKTVKSPSERLSNQRKNKMSQNLQIKNYLIKEDKSIALKLNQNSKIVDFHMKKNTKKTEQLPHLPITHFSNEKSKRWQSCRVSSFDRDSSQIDRLSKKDLQSYFQLVISDISIHFHKNSPGEKHIQLTSGSTTHSTENQSGNNLIWTGKHLSFENRHPNDSLILAVKGDPHRFNLGKIKITLHDLLINKNQNYYRSLLLNEREVLGIVTLGYEIKGKAEIAKRYVFPRQKQQQSSNQSLTEMKRNRIFYNKDETTYRRNKFQHIQTGNTPKLPSPKKNKIKMKKYLGGKNIKIGRAHRFYRDLNDYNPGPADYQILSSFSRHAIKED